MWKRGCEMEPRKPQPKCLQNFARIQPGRRLAPIKLYIILCIRSRCGAAEFSFSPVSPVWVPFTGFPSTPAPNTTLLHCYDIYNASILKQMLIGVSSEMHLFPAKVGAKSHRAPHSPPECQIHSKCQWLRHEIEYLAFRWGTGGFGLTEKLIGPVWGDFGTGTIHKTMFVQ